MVDCENRKKLSTEENKKRLDTCGQDIDITENQVISYATNGKTYSTATFISPRHILTSADLVLSPAGNWIGTKEYYNKAQCSDEKTSWLSVPQNAFTHLNLGFYGQITCRGNLCNMELLEIEYGFIFCNKEWERFHSNGVMTYPMVLVTKTDDGALWPCLRTDEILILEGTPLDFYEYNLGKDKVRNDTVKFLETHPGVVRTRHPTHQYGNGVLITKQYPHELIAIGGSAIYFFVSYFDVRTLQDAFCSEFNICPREGATLPQPKTGKLTEEEDSLRKKNCGNALDDAYGIAKYDGIESTVTLISPRHVLMSPILKFYQIFDTKHCKKEEKDLVKIGLDIFPDLELYVAGVSLKPVAGIVICNEETLKRAGQLSFPMIVEVEQNLDDIGTPCLPDRVLDFTNNSVKEGMEVLNVFHSKDIVMFKWLNVTADILPAYINTYKPVKNNQKGAALLEPVNNKLWYLIGMYAGEHEQKSWYFDIQWILEDLCELSGICQPLAPEQPLVTTIVATTEAPAPPTTDAPSTTLSPVPSPTETPTTETAILEESTMESPLATGFHDSTTPISPELSTPEKPTPHEPVMEPIPVIDLDEEFREFQERQEKEDRGDWDEWGNDFYRSADFFSSGWGSELFVGFLMVILVIIVV
ncbi:unnamed protein product [Caenorhabditis brenneri]